MSLVLASASPQRKTLLEGLGVSFAIHPSDLDESLCEERDPKKRSLSLARMKAISVSKDVPDAYVIGCDTLVVSNDGILFEKPLDEEDARRMIVSHAGTTIAVHSGLCVLSPDGRITEGVSSSAVTFKELSDAEIDWWIGTNLWKDRSGSFQIDGPGQLMISRLDGDWSSVVGLPVFLLGELLEDLGCSELMFV